MATRVLAFLVLLLISPAAYAATTHTVGGTNGWRSGVNYDSWSGAQTFTVGDSLLFNYDFTHGVDEVNEGNYQNCNTVSPLTSSSSSPTSITLTTPGTHYFVCPQSNHCSEGMKVAVTVVAAGGSNPPSTPSTPSTPGTSPTNPGTSPSTPGTSPSTPTTTPAGSSAAPTILGGCRTALVIGLVTLLGMMG